MGFPALRDGRTFLLWALVATTAAACARDEGGLPKADQSLLAERLSLQLEVLPVEAMVRTFEATSDLEKKLGSERSSNPIAKADQETIASEWRRLSSAMRALSAWTGDRTLTASERAEERERLRTMREALGKIRALLVPHRTWVEDHFGKGIFEDV